MLKLIAASALGAGLVTGVPLIAQVTTDATSISVRLTYPSPASVFSGRQ
jgi:hypothetical protein